MTNEQVQMLQASATPGFQLIMKRLQDVADELQKDYDNICVVTDPQRVLQTHLTREIIRVTIPRIMEGIMNVDQPEVRWTFKGCLRSILAVACLALMCSSADAFDVSSITFGIASSAITATPNLRIGVMKGTMGKDGNVVMQGMVIPRPVNYHLTKSKVHTFVTGTTAIEIQADQDTKMYVGGDLTNYLLIYSGVPVTYVIK